MAEANAKDEGVAGCDETQEMILSGDAAELVRLLDEYMSDLQAGRAPDKEKLLAEHPGLAGQLQSCLASIEFIHGVGKRSDQTPAQLGDFRIVGEIGRGGMGVVYEAQQLSLKRRVALKVLRFGGATDPEAMQRFQTEAETVAHLHHTNIVPIFAVGCEQGVHYYAMQFIEGRSLSAECGVWNAECPDSNSALRTPNSALQVAGWGLQAAEALTHAHERGVIHRDIKPSNLLLDEQGTLWLTDFGLAKRADEVTMTVAGAILGTPRYMSPEQTDTVTRPVDHRTDIYSLGATLYELATGQPVFTADTPLAVIQQIKDSEPKPPRLLRPELPRDIETVILKCLAKDAARRYQSTKELADDLRAVTEGRAIKARRATVVEQAARWVKQQKGSVGVAAATVAATVFVVIGSLIAWQMHGQSRLGYLTLNTPRDGAEQAEVAEVLSLDDEPVGAPFTLPTKEPLALPEGAYRLRLTAPAKVSQTYLFDVSAGAHQTHEVGLINETVGHPIPLHSPVGAEIVQSSRHAPRDETRSSSDPVRANDFPSTKNAGSAPGFPHAEREGYFEPRLFVGPQNQSKPTLRCYVGNSQPGWNPDGSRTSEVAPLWEANWSLESPDVVSLLKLPADREAWKVWPAQTDVFAWQQVLAWFDPWWFRNGSPPKVFSSARDLDGDGVADVLWTAAQLANRQQGSFGPGPLTPKAAVLVAASGKDGKPLWWFRPQDSNGGASWLMTAPVWANEGVIVCAVRSMNSAETWLEWVNAQTGASIWKCAVPHASGTTQPSLLNSADLQSVRATTETVSAKPFVVAMVGRMLMAVDADSGEPLWEPHDLGEGLQRPPRFADLDSDGVPEVLSVVPPDGGVPQLTAMSLTDRQRLWSAPVIWFPNDSSSVWPEIVDLDDDGRLEVVLSNNETKGKTIGAGVQVLDGRTGQPRWSRRFPVDRGQQWRTHSELDRYTVGPDLDGDGQRELVMTSVRSEFRSRAVGSLAPYQFEEKFLYVDCFSGRDGSSVWWQRMPLGMSDFACWTGAVGELLWWGGANAIRLVIPVHRHPDTQADGGTHSIYVLSAATGRIEHQADDVALPQLVDWNNDGLDDLAVFMPDDPVRFEQRHHYPIQAPGKFAVLRGSPPEAFRRLDRWTEEQDFDGDGIAELSKRHDGGPGDYALLIASGRDGRIMSKWKTEWPETPREFTVGNVQSFPPPLGDFDGDGFADLLISREQHNWDVERVPLVKTGQAPLLLQAVSSKTGTRIWGGVPLALPDWLRPKNADENSEEWMLRRFGRLDPVSTQAVDLDRDGRPELLHALRMVGYGRSEQIGGGPLSDHQQPYVALIDARAGTLRWFEPISELVPGDHAPGLEYMRIDASTDLNGDGTRDLVLTVPQQSPQGPWSLSLQVHSGRDGKVLWGPKPLEGTSHNNNDFNPPIVSDLDGDGRPELVLMVSKQPHVTVLRGDTGEQLWTWQGSQPPNFAAPGIAVVQSSRHAPRDEPNASPILSVSSNSTDSSTSNAQSAHHAERDAYIGRCVAVAFNETGSQWDIALLDHEGQLIERVPAASNQLWSHDLDGDGGEELLRQVDNKITATRGLHDVLWTWLLTSQSYGWISHIERTNDGRVIVAMSGNDSLTLLDGRTGKSLSRSFRSTNTSLHENGRVVDLNRLTLNSAGESPRLLTRVGDSQVLLGHVVSRAVLPTDANGRYQSSRHAPRDEPSGTRDRALPGAFESQTTKAHHAERDRYKDDPRLVRQLMWAPTPAEWTARRGQILKDVLLAVALSLVVVLIPYWLIRAGVRRRDPGRWRIALMGGGVTLFVAWLMLLRFPPPGAMWRDVPWALPFVMSVGGLPILLYPVGMLRAFVNGDWRRIRWLVIATIVLALALGAVLMAVDLSHKPSEQHYSWFGWWLIFAMGAYFTGGYLVLGHVFGPAARWLWKRLRARLPRHA